LKRLLLIDADGVMTNGDLIYTGSGMSSLTFNVKDGYGIMLLLANGISVGVISCGHSKALLKRCKDLCIPIVRTNVRNKYDAVFSIITEERVHIKDVVYIGDDLPDLKAFKLAGTSVAVNDAVEEVRASADIITKNNGGCGAVREVCDMILEASV